MNQENETSDDAASTPEKRKTEPVDSMPSLSSLENTLDCSMNTAKINSLECFPVEVLEKIFIRTDDVTLMHLADTCKRFAAIVPTVFSMKYSERYFMVNERLGGDPEIYTALFNRFGNTIKAVQVNNAKFIDGNHWVWKLLRPYINHIEKLTFDWCTFEPGDMFQQPMENLTHLVFRYATYGDPQSWEMALPLCGKLIKLELHETECFSYNSILRTIENNPALQRLLLNGFVNHHQMDLNLGDLITLIADHLNDIKELALADYYFFEWVTAKPESVDKIVNSFKNLESLVLSVHSDATEFIQRLGIECKSIKYLGWHQANRVIADERVQMIHRSICSFTQIECLYWKCDSSIISIDSIVNHLPNLRHLCIEIIYERLKDAMSYVLPSLRYCQSLQKITLKLKRYWGHHEDSKYFINVRFFEEFMSTIIVDHRPNIRVELEYCDQVIGIITKNGIVWRNKRMHWMDCDKNDTNIQLLDFAEQTGESAVEMNFATEPMQQAIRESPLDQIFDYLDIHSLSSFAETSKRSKQLVERYVKMHSKRNGPFIITDEFHSYWSPSNYLNGQLESLKSICASFVTDLRIYNPGNYLQSLGGHDTDMTSYECLTKVSFYDEHPLYWELPKSVRHIVVDGSRFQSYKDLCLCRIFEKHEHIETLELKNAGLLNDFEYDEKTVLKFGNSKKLIFNYRGETQFDNLKKIFKDTNIQLVPVFPNSNAN